MIDVHTHIFSSKMVSTRETYFENEPTFQMLYASPQSKLVTADTLVAEMDVQGVEKSVVFGFPWRTASFFRENNDAVMAAVAAYPDRLMGMGCFDPLHPKAVEEAERCLAGGLKGMGELAVYDRGLDANVIQKMTPIMDLCREQDVPLLIHTNEPVGPLYPGKAPMSLTEIYAFLSAFPDNTIILAHWGGGILFYHLMKKQVKTVLKKVYVDTAASPYLYDASVYRIAAEIFGHDRILFGSDYPLLKPERYVRDMTASGLDPEIMADILGRNAARLFGDSKT